MPVPLTNACLVLCGIFAAMGADTYAVVMGAAGILNQVLVEFATPSRPAGDDNGAG